MVGRILFYLFIIFILSVLSTYVPCAVIQTVQQVAKDLEMNPMTVSRLLNQFGKGLREKNKSPTQSERSFYLFI